MAQAAASAAPGGGHPEEAPRAAGGGGALSSTTPAPHHGATAGHAGLGASSGGDAARAARLAPLRDELDPGGTHGTQRLWAAIRAQGLDPEDVDPVRSREVNITPLVPDKDKAKRLGDQRAEVWDGLRQSRVREIKATLETLDNDDVSRFGRTGHGIRPVTKDDIPSADSLQGMGDFNDMMARKQEQNRREQQRKASLLATNFLMEKKRMDEADAKVEALENRLKAYKKEQDDKWKLKKIECAKKTEKRVAGSERAARTREEWENETEKVKTQRLLDARSRRASFYSKEGLAAKIEASESKRQIAFSQALEIERDMLERLEMKREALEERLEERDRCTKEELAARAAAAHQRFQDKQIKIAAHTQEWAENKLKEHNEFNDKLNNGIQAGRANLKEKSKSCHTIGKKAQEKWQANYDRRMTEKSNFHSNLMERHMDAHNRCQDQSLLRLKCGNDVHSFREYKQGTWGELQNRRYKETKGYRDAHTQSLVFQIAEKRAKSAAQDEGHAETSRRRQAIAKELLRFSDKARAGFLKIQCERDEGKVMKMMADLGFDMPKLPEDDEEGGAEDAPKAGF